MPMTVSQQLSKAKQDMIADIKNKLDHNYAPERATSYDPYGKLMNKKPLLDPYRHDLKYRNELYNNEKTQMAKDPNNKLPETYQENFHDRQWEIAMHLG